MKKLTPWYPADVKPVRVGVYETRHDNFGLAVHYQHWNGEFWGGYTYLPSMAYDDRRYMSIYQSVQWRGLAQDPNA